MTRYLLQPVPTAPETTWVSQGHQPLLDKPASPSLAAAQSTEAVAADMYLVLMRLPLQDVLRSASDMCRWPATGLQLSSFACPVTGQPTKQQFSCDIHSPALTFVWSWWGVDIWLQHFERKRC